jgi:phage-related protein
MIKYFEVDYLEQADEFIGSLPENVRRKILYNIDKAKQTRDSELFKKLSGTDIWEFRTLYQGLCYRLFAFWDEQKRAMVICTHGIIKKTQKTPPGEIQKAERLRNEYFKTK